VLSTPPAFVLSQDQTLQTKTTQPKKPGEFTIRENLTKQPDKSGQKNKPPPKREKENGQKQQQTKTTKHTIEFSNNTPALQATLPLYCMWTETSNLVLQSDWPGAVGFSSKTTPLSG
jgi:hypothetical protein